MGGELFFSKKSQPPLNIKWSVPYRPPSSLVSWYDIFEHQLDIASKIKSHLIVLEDFNVNISVNSERKLSNLCTSYGLSQIIKDPTRVTSNTSTLIDHIYVSNTNHVGKVYVPRFSISDHYSVGLTWKVNVADPKLIHSIIQYRKPPD